MKVIGIIAEYNPFHNGHAYQIAEIRKRTGADYIIVAMSGDFVQRGAPALLDKYVRTRMALLGGADLVLELPVYFATSSAESFAMAGVTLFDKMGCVDGLCFGAETDDISLLSDIATLLVAEPQEYKDALSMYLKGGFSFPTARAKAVNHFFAHADEVMNNPNNILAIEYLKGLKRRNSAIIPYLIKREGAGYHELHMHTDSIANSTTVAPIASATALREHILQGNAFAELSPAIPHDIFSLLSDYLKESTPLCLDDFSQILGYQLLSATPALLAQYSDCSIELANRLYNNRSRFFLTGHFIEFNKSKEITYARLSRIMTHLLLDINKEKILMGKRLDYIPYLRILGFRKTNATRDCVNILSTLKQTAQVPIITKLADAKNRLPEHAFSMLEDDINAATLYEQIKFQKQQQNPLMFSETAAVKNEYTQGLVLL